jgi:hypothetical protein
LRKVAFPEDALDRLAIARPAPSAAEVVRNPRRLMAPVMGFLLGLLVPWLIVEQF